jgi:hypothetical protein
MSVTRNDAHVRGEHRGGAARATTPRDSALLSVLEIAEWVPESYRQAYLDGVASVLGSEPLADV